MRQEAAGGYVLMAAAALALLLANSPWASAYNAVLHIEVGGTIAGLAMRESLAHWINDGLMAVFFLLVGLEIKREMLDGQLSSWSRRILPGAGAAAVSCGDRADVLGEWADVVARGCAPPGHA